jgi:hypothetical protein
MITKTSFIDGRVSRAVQEGQEEMVNSSRGVFMSANTDAYISAQYRSSGAHLTTAGVAAMMPSCLASAIAALALGE